MSSLSKSHFCRIELKRTSPFKSSEYLKHVVETLKKHGVENPRQEAEIFLSEILNLDGIDLYLKDIEPEKYKLKNLDKLIKRRLRGEPLQYLTKNAFFYGLKFKVDKGVFIPRPETEILVETVLNIIRDNKLDNPQIVDIGTGCANIAISLTKHLISCRILATDISKISLKIAKQNAKRYNLQDKITFLKGNLFEPLENFKEKIDIIVSNPPYVSSYEISRLQREVKREPFLALFGGKDGLYFYKRIIKEAHFYLKTCGFIVMEAAKGRSKIVLKKILADSRYRIISCIKDYNNIDRVIVAQKI